MMYNKYESNVRGQIFNRLFSFKDNCINNCLLEKA